MFSFTLGVMQRDAEPSSLSPTLKMCKKSKAQAGRPHSSLKPWTVIKGVDLDQALWMST